MIIEKTAALNLKADGTNQGCTLPTITTLRQSVGVYAVDGVKGLASSGWTTTIKKDMNGSPTISLSVEGSDTGVLVRTFERGTTTPCDIVDALTLRFDVEIEVPDQVEETV